jgi:hypothetical protein
MYESTVILVSSTSLWNTLCGIHVVWLCLVLNLQHNDFIASVAFPHITKAPSFKKLKIYCIKDLNQEVFERVQYLKII